MTKDSNTKLPGQAEDLPKEVPSPEKTPEIQPDKTPEIEPLPEEGPEIIPEESPAITPEEIPYEPDLPTEIPPET